MADPRYETLFDIPIFTWEEWDECDIDEFIFYNVEFPFYSMSQYNGCDCMLNRNGKLQIEIASKDREGVFIDTEIVWEGFVCEIPEFMEQLNKKYNTKDN